MQRCVYLRVGPVLSMSWGRYTGSVDVHCRCEDPFARMHRIHRIADPLLA